MSHAAQVPNPAATVVVAAPLHELVRLDALASGDAGQLDMSPVAVRVAWGQPRQRPTGTPPRT